jgi:serine O-acetyltransferase
MINTLIRFRNLRIVREVLALYCIEIPVGVIIGKNFKLIHRGFCTVIHPSTEIGNNVTIYHNVTIGRKDAYVPYNNSKMEKIVICDDVVVFPGSVLLGGDGVTRIEKGCIVAANSVLTQSTGENEIWGGVPAKKIGIRKGV